MKTDMTSKTSALAHTVSGRFPAVYIHLPFCVSKCAYCDFYSLPCKRDSSDTRIPEPPPYADNCFSKDTYELQGLYVDALCRQIRLTSMQHGRPRISTVFIGGGTPSVLKLDEMQRIFDTVFDCFNVEKDAEITLEANPETLSFQKLCAYKKMGINRLSIGMQSAVDTELKTISRIHSLDSVKAAVKSARTAGFDNLNLDIMYALPFQTLDSFSETLSAVLSLAPEHVSVYGLQLEEGTPLFKNRNSLAFPGEDGENEMNALALDVLEKNGFVRYEISNYARPGFECKHNLAYWTLGEYFGFGTAAHSFVDGKRYSIKKDIHAYCCSADFSDVTETEELLTEDALTEEYVMLSLRLCRGLSFNGLSALTDRAEEYFKRAGPFIRGGFMELCNEKNSPDRFLRFTPKGFNVSNTVISEILYH